MKPISRGLLVSGLAACSAALLVSFATVDRAGNARLIVVVDLSPACAVAAAGWGGGETGRSMELCAPR